MINERNQMLIGESGIERLRGLHVLVVGLGGVGGYAADALARAGIGRLTVVDHDTVEESNLNRQIYALKSTVGRYKCELARERIEDINSECEVSALPLFYEKETDGDIFSVRPDYIIDAIDTVTCKTELICKSHERDIPIISALGTGDKLDPCRLTVADIYETSVCPLARVIRKNLRDRGIKDHKVVYSTETPRRVETKENSGTGRKDTPGSMVFVPACAGFICASEAVRDLLGVYPDFAAENTRRTR